MKKLLPIILLCVTSYSFGQVKDAIKWQNNQAKDSIQSNTTINNSNDSILNEFSSSINSIELLDNPLEKLESSKDSLFDKKKLIPSLSGQLSLGYEYGLLAGYIDPENIAPLNVFNTRGDLSLEALKLPFNVSYNYSTFKNPLGVNNFFRISLDTEKLKQNASQKKSDVTGSIENSIQELESGKGEIKGKLGMGEVLMQKLKREMQMHERKLSSYQNQLDSQKSVDTTTLLNIAKNNTQSKTDSLQLLYQTTKAKYDNALQLYDTINALYQKAMNVYSLYSNWQKELENKKHLIEGYKNVENGDLLEAKTNEKKNSFLKDIKTLDFGLTYPQTTSLSKNSVPVQGINFEIQQNNWYTAVSSGITMNNLMVSTDVVQNKLTNSQNLFNQFDFQNIEDRGLLTSIKTGYGKKDQTHYFIGFRYLTNSIDQNSTANSNIPSLGSEIDIRWVPKFSRGTILDFVYGKTSFNQSIVDSSRNNVFSSLFSGDRTNTSLIKLTQQVNPLRTEIQLSMRWIDPYADMRSLGVLQPDNLRYEIRTNTSLNKNARFGLNYRRDRNNIASYSDTTISLEVIGGQISGQIVKGLSYFGSLNYLTQNSKLSTTQSKTHNYMLGLGLTSKYKILDIENATTLSYNDYLITDAFSTGLFRNVSIQNATKFNVGVNSLTLSYFKMDDKALLINSSIVIGDEFSMQKERFKASFGLKTVFSEQYGNDLGVKILFAYHLTSFLEWSIQGEKLVLGDFYNYYARDRFDRFPYAIITRINFTLN